MVPFSMLWGIALVSLIIAVSLFILEAAASMVIAYLTELKAQIG